MINQETLITGLLIFIGFALVCGFIALLFISSSNKKSKTSKSVETTPVDPTKPPLTPPPAPAKPEAKKEKKKGGNKLAWFVFLVLIVGAGYYWQAEVLRFIDLIRQANAASTSAQAPVTQGYVELPEPLDDPDVKSFVIEVGPEPSRVLTEIPANHHVRVGPVDKDPRKRVKILTTGSNYSSSCKDSKNGDCWIGKDTPIKDAQIRLKSVNGDKFLALVRYSPVRK